MSSLFVLGHVEVPVRITGSGMITKREKIPVVGDDPRHYPPLVALALNPEMIDWLLEELDRGRTWSEDGFVRELRSLRDDMKEALWERAAS